jgi:dephospho-CoA kinase
MQKPRVLALVGMAGSGKTLAARHLEAKGYYQFRFGGIVTGEVERRGWTINPENERIVREEFRANEGMDVMAKRALPLLHQALENRETIVIDGLYSFSEYKTLRHEFGDGLVVIAIITPRSLRYSRLAQRKERPLTPQEAETRDWQEIEALEKGGPIAIADYSLANDKNPDDLLAALDDLLDELGVKA